MLSCPRCLSTEYIIWSDVYGYYENACSFCLRGHGWMFCKIHAQFDIHPFWYRSSTTTSKERLQDFKKLYEKCDYSIKLSNHTDTSYPYKKISLEEIFRKLD